MWPFNKKEQRSEVAQLTIKNLSEGIESPTSVANVFAVTSFISKQCAGYELEAPDRYKTLINNGFEGINGNALWSSVYLSLLNSGNAYLLLDWSSDGQLLGYKPVTASPHILSDENAQPFIKSYNVGGKNYPLYKVAHFRINSTNGLMGRSPITVCRESVKAISKVESFGSEIFEFIKRPSGLFKLAGNYKDDGAIKRFKESVMRTPNGKSLVLENGIDYQPLTMSATDADFVEQQKFSVEQACRLFALDPVFVSHSGTNSQSYASQREASKGLYNNTLKPYLSAIASELNQKLLTEPQRMAGEKIQVNQNELLSLGVKDRAEVYKTLVDMGAITPQQVAQREGFDYANKETL